MLSERYLPSQTTTDGIRLESFQKDVSPNGYDKSITIITEDYNSMSHFHKLLPSISNHTCFKYNSYDESTRTNKGMGFSSGNTMPRRTS
mmetsp:Transcript_10882/g.11007  ORF Transcript_10882/g.11007 Transcript_10882/m.11007 type:complete len:89 (+) Transcript_10882:337-603(+)